jgi:hypothetical protein
MPRGSAEIPRSLRKEWRKLAEAMVEAGWTFEQGGSHVKAYGPDGVAFATLSGTPGDQRAWKNARADFRRWCRGHGVEPGI